MRRLMLLSLCAAVAWGAATLQAQSRLQKNVGTGAATVRNPGETSRVSGSSSSFRQYSYGLSGGSQYNAPTVNVLGGSGAGVNIMGGGSYDSYANRRYNFDANRSATGMPSALPALRGDNQIYQGISMDIQSDLGEGAAGALLRRRSSLWSVQFNHGDGPLGKQESEPITSLVPAGQGLYRDYMKEGEDAFRANDYAKAFSKFRMANYIGQKDPESLLSMSHAQFAAKCYPLAAYYLRQALKYMPRLPMVPLRPKGFYSDPSLYVQNVQDLDDCLALNPQNADLLLLRAYCAWFDADELYSDRIAKESLEKALSDNCPPEVMLSIEQFWDGMVATGKVKGSLKRPPAPHATTQAAKP